MNFPLRVCAVAALLSCLAVAPVVAEMPSSTPDTPPAPPAAPTAPPSAAPSMDGAPLASPAPIDPAKEAEIRKLLELTGTVKLVDQMKKQMFAIIRQRSGSLPQEFWDRIDKEMDSRELVEKLIPLYDKYYTLDDLKAVNAFYQTPAGQHLLQTQPQILKESMKVGQEWGREASIKVMMDMQDYQQRMSTTPPSTNNTPQPAAQTPAPPSPPPSTPAPPSAP